MAVAQRNTQGVVVNQEAGVAFSEQDRIEVKQTGHTVQVQYDIYSKTNHYIQESHGYVPEDKSRKLTRYAHLPLLHWVFLGFFIVGLISPAHFTLGFSVAVISIPFILLFAQHMYVVMVTIPIILKLPHLPNNLMRSENSFFEVTLEKYRSVFAATPEEAVSVAIASKGTIKIHVLSARARNNVKRTRIVSVLGLTASIFMFFYSGALGGYRLWQLELKDTF